MRQKKIIAILLLTLFPALALYITTLFSHYGIGLALRVVVHIMIPVAGVMAIRKTSFGKAFVLPLKISGWKKTLVYGGIGAVISAATIFGVYLALRGFIDFQEIRSNLLTDYGITPAIFPWIALSITAVNPFLEEYFWRGFVYRGLDKHVRSRSFVMILTGVLFALHHVIIIRGWFNPGQFLFVTVFLAIAGIGFNLVYKKTGSIWAGWLIHTVADLTIVIIAFMRVF